MKLDRKTVDLDLYEEHHFVCPVDKEHLYDQLYTEWRFHLRTAYKLQRGYSDFYDSSTNKTRLYVRGMDRNRIICSNKECFCSERFDWQQKLYSYLDG